MSHLLNTYAPEEMKSNLGRRFPVGHLLTSGNIATRHVGKYQRRIDVFLYRITSRIGHTYFK